MLLRKQENIIITPYILSINQEIVKLKMFVTYVVKWSATQLSYTTGETQLSNSE